MKDMSRAIRRHHAARLKANRKVYWGGLDPQDPKFEKRLGMLVATACVCSCPMCGNARNHFGHRTIAEESFAQTLDF